LPQLKYLIKLLFGESKVITAIQWQYET